MIDESQLKLLFISIPEDDHLVCEVSYRDVFVCELHIVPHDERPEDFTVHVEFLAQSPFVDSLPVDDFVQLLTFAKELYVMRLLQGPNPFEMAG
ncbi:hypothetical protein [Flaviflagellibacter deserti]|uniref:Uncharacterized protein n=1 Tax=Flaviflagellibacter deserti TaxID=2267266 RepID=A0ABV9YYI2_9HYPH